MNRHFTLLATVFLLGACATQMDKDEPDPREATTELQYHIRHDDAVLVDQDIGQLTFKDRGDEEDLKNLEVELREARRLPTEEAPAPETVVEVKGLKEVGTQVDANSDKPLTKVFDQSGAVRAAAPKANDTESPSVNSKGESSKLEAPGNTKGDSAMASVQPLSQEELTKQLFDADVVIVAKGDTLGSLAKKHLGTSSEWKHIASLNPNIRNPHNIEVGEKIYMPKFDVAKIDAKKVSAFPMAPAPASIPSRGIASVSTPVSAPVAAALPAPPAKKKGADKTKVPDAQPEFNAKALETGAVAVPTAAPGPVQDAAAFIPTSATASTHDVNEMMREKSALNHLKRNKGKQKDTLAQNPAPRKPDSVEDVASNNVAPGASSEEKVVNSSQKNLSKIIGILGLILLVGVTLSFMFSKPQKNS